MRRSAHGSGDLKGATGYGASFLVLKGALCVSLMIRTLVRTVEAMMDAAKKNLAALQELRRYLAPGLGEVEAMMIIARLQCCPNI